MAPAEWWDRMAEATLQERPAADALAAAGRDAGGETVDLAIVVALLRRRWWLVALIMAAFVALAGVYAVVTPKTWRTSTRVLLDPRDKQLVGTDVTKPQYSVEPGWVETRLELVKSYGNLAAVVKRENLTADGEIMGSGAAEATPDAAVARAVRNLAEMVIVERPKENNLIDVTVTTRDPDKSARLAQAVAEAFVAGLAQSKVAQLEQADTLLSRQVEGMRDKMQSAEAKVEDYKRANGISVTRGALVDEETLRQLNESLVAARARAQETRERWEKLKQATKSGEVQFPAGLDGVGSAVLSRLKIEAALAAARRTETEQDYGPLHPKARAAQAETERARLALQDQLKSLISTAEMDYQLARSNEENVRKNLDRAQARLADTGQAMVALQELEGEAQARRELYKSFVSRLQETVLQKTTQVSDATIVSPAQVPLKPFAPRLSLALALALLAGLGTGVSAALYGGRREVAELLRRRGATEAPRADAAPAPATRDVAAPALAEPETVVPRPLDPDAFPTVAMPVEAPPAASEAAPDLPPADDVGLRARAPLDAAVRPVGEPIRIDLALTAERIARLGGVGGPGTGAVDAFVETADGKTDFAGLAMLRRLADELGRSDRPEARVFFANTVPTLITAALAHGMARAEAEAGRRILLLDLAADFAPLDAAFARAAPISRSRRHAIERRFEIRVDEHGVALARPHGDLAAGVPSRQIERLSAFVEAALRDHDGVVVHLGDAPPASVLFDVAEVAEHVVLVVDAKDLGGSRVPGEIAVMRGLLPHFDGIMVLDVAGEPAVRPDDRRRTRRA